ncbi:MAG: hypothetical protein E6J31_11475 [Chloroflexi bacterium]|nr:MAG: hypothetical protein E6J31_11475 [Chloroflexota bacterium]
MEAALPHSHVVGTLLAARAHLQALQGDPWRESERSGMHLIGTLMLLLKGAIDFETRKHDSVVKCTTSLFFVLCGKAEMVSSSRLRVGGFPSPRVHAWGLSPRSGKHCTLCCNQRLPVPCAETQR